VVNGGFEDDLKAWKVLSGSPYTEGYDYAHTGMAALTLRGMGGSAGPSSQAIGTMITVPAQAQRPTLSFFLMRVDAGMPWDRLSVTIGEEGATPIPLTLNRTEHGLLAHVWADLAGWQGKTVILTFRSDLTGAEPDGRLIIDDVSVGDWNTPVVLDVERPREQPQRLVVRGDNFLPGAKVRIDDMEMPATVVNATTLEVPLAPAAPVGVRSLWVTNPGGEQAQRRVVIGAPVFLPLLRYGD
jgi:hypothetical protein